MRSGNRPMNFGKSTRIEDDVELRIHQAAMDERSGSSGRPYRRDNSVTYINQGHNRGIPSINNNWSPSAIVSVTAPSRRHARYCLERPVVRFTLMSFTIC